MDKCFFSFCSLRGQFWDTFHKAPQKVALDRTLVTRTRANLRGHIHEGAASSQLRILWDHISKKSTWTQILRIKFLMICFGRTQAKTKPYNIPEGHALTKAGRKTQGLKKTPRGDNSPPQRFSLTQNCGSKASLREICYSNGPAIKLTKWNHYDHLSQKAARTGKYIFNTEQHAIF